MKHNLPNFLIRMIPTLLVCTVVIFASIMTYLNLLEIEERRCSQRLNEAAEHVMEEVTLSMEHNAQVLRLTSLALTQHSEDHISLDACASQLAIYQQQSMFSRIDILYPDDSLQLQAGRTMDSSALSFDRIAAAGEHCSAPMEDPLTGERVIHYYVPVLCHDQVTAVLVGVLECDLLPERFVSTAYDGNVAISIVQRDDGALILDGWNSGLNSLFEEQTRILSDQYKELDLITEIRNGRSGTVSYEMLDGTGNSYLVYQPFESFAWEMLCFVREDVAFASLQNAKQIMVYFGITEALLLILYFFWNVYTLSRLRQSKASSEKQLLISNTLVECITSLSSYSDIHAAINNLLGTLTRYFDGDRTYLFEFDFDKQTTSNTYEYTTEGVSKEIDNLQDVPLVVIEAWIRKFKEEGTFYISHIDKDVHKDSDTYRILDAQGIESLIAVPLKENDVIIGFLGVDNPKRNYRDLSLLSSTTFFIMDSLQRRKYQESLEQLSFEDTLTKLHNRNKFNQIVELCKKERPHAIGVAYFDLNGLKVMNDRLGHQAGDAFIQATAETIRKEFGQYAYRIGGDEFTVIMRDISEFAFFDAVARVSLELKERNLSVSIGTAWAGEDNDIETQLHEADLRMYEDKEKYYSNHKHDRRKTPR